jgi:hypothetical protein
MGTTYYPSKRCGGTNKARKMIQELVDESDVILDDTNKES